jgi:predicted amidophosphoribosyltransferase
MFCPNCGKPCANSRSPYCSDECREVSALVRQLRLNLRSGAIYEIEKQIGLGEKFWRVMGGGYPRRRMLATGPTVARILKREQGVCQQCGAEATTIDHCGSG